jgi:hypothetical protein
VRAPGLVVIFALLFSPKVAKRHQNADYALSQCFDVGGCNGSRGAFFPVVFAKSEVRFNYLTDRSRH